MFLFIRVPVIWARIIFYSQYLVCKFLFFADKEGKFISITNRYIYMHEYDIVDYRATCYSYYTGSNANIYCVAWEMPMYEQLVKEKNKFTDFRACLDQRQI